MDFLNELIGILLLAVHLLCVNLAGIGPLIAAWLSGGERESMQEGSQHPPIARGLLKNCIYAFLVGMLIGGVLMLWSPAADLWPALRRFPARTYYFAGLELFFSLVCMLGMLWSLQPQRKSGWLSWLLALFSATNLLYHFPPLMAVLGKLAVDSDWTKLESISHAQQLELSKRPEIVALSVHFVCASVAVAAIAALECLRRSSALQTDDGKLSRKLARLALLFTLLQLPVGLWLLTSLPASDMRALMGSSLVGSLSFLLALTLTLMLLQRLTAIGWGLAEAGEIRGVGWLTVLIVVLMTATLRFSRM